jgi:hypothetical protein
MLDFLNAYRTENAVTVVTMVTYQPRKDGTNQTYMKVCIRPILYVVDWKVYFK